MKEKKSYRLLVSFNESQWSTLQALMQQNLQTSASAYLSFLIAKEYATLTTPPPKRGRPSKVELAEDQANEIANIPHPDQIMNPGRMVTRTEYDTLMALKNPQQ